jgi:hypothetical protein
MIEPALHAKDILYTIACAAFSGTLVPNFVREAQATGWRVCVITTPQGTNTLVLAIPCVLSGSGLDTHPAFSKSREFLRGCGVHVIYEPEKYPPTNEVPWEIILDELQEMMRTYALEQKPDQNRPSGV